MIAYRSLPNFGMFKDFSGCSAGDVILLTSRNSSDEVRAAWHCQKEFMKPMLLEKGLTFTYETRTSSNNTRIKINIEHARNSKI